MLETRLEFGFSRDEEIPERFRHRIGVDLHLECGLLPPVGEGIVRIDGGDDPVFEKTFDLVHFFQQCGHVPALNIPQLDLLGRQSAELRVTLPELHARIGAAGSTVFPIGLLEFITGGLERSQESGVPRGEESECRECGFFEAGFHRVNGGVHGFPDVRDLPDLAPHDARLNVGYNSDRDAEHHHRSYPHAQFCSDCRHMATPR